MVSFTDGSPGTRLSLIGSTPAVNLNVAIDYVLQTPPKEPTAGDAPISQILIVLRLTLPSRLAKGKLTCSISLEKEIPQSQKKAKDEAGPQSNRSLRFFGANVALFQRDRSDDDGLDVYARMRGSTGDVKTGRQLQATVACELDNDDLSRTAFGSPGGDGSGSVVNIAAATFFETDARLEDLSLQVHDVTFAGKTHLRSSTIRTVPKVKLGAPRGTGDFDGPFSWVARNSWLEVLQIYKRTWGTLSQTPLTHMGRTPISWAAANGADEIVKWYMAEDATDVLSARLQRQDEKGRTPLSLAALYDRTSTVELLLGHDISLLDHVDGDDRTPLSLAAGKGNYGTVKALLLALEELPGDSKEAIIDYLERQDAAERTALSRAAMAGRSIDVLEVIVRESISLRAPTDTGLRWVIDRVFEAAENGWAILIKVLLECGNGGEPVPVKNILGATKWTGNSDPMTPLCIAAQNGHARAVDLLLDFGADPRYVTETLGNTALMLAILGDAEPASKEAVVERLLSSSGAFNITTPNTSNQTALSLSVDKNLPAIRILLSRWDEDGLLASKPYQLDPYGVDSEAMATATKFSVEAGVMRSQPSKIPVATLLDDPEETTRGDGIAFRWFHLPANNMRWVEVLMTQLYETTSTYKILKSERWVRRQHQSVSVPSRDHGGVVAPSEIHHARFMRPLCQSFDASSNSYQPAPSAGARQPPRNRNYVVFMPYLHWDIKSQQTRRMDIMNHGIWQEPGTSWTSEQKLLNFYLFKNLQLAPEPGEKATDEPKSNTIHRLHVRRTLDQYYYYTLEQTQERDGDQVVSRAPCQRYRHPESKVLTMVDQLWLWVLAGQGDQPDTVISCFPERPKATPGSESSETRGSIELPYDPDDTYGTTDVLGHIKVHLLNNPSSVGSCHDLARLIASKCSGAYFDMGSSDERLRFPEIYEMAIGDVVRKETGLFDEFTDVMKTHRSETSTRKDVMKLLREVEKLEDAISKTAEPGPGLTDEVKQWRTENKEMARKLCKAFYKTALRQQVGKGDLETLLDLKSKPEQRIDILDALRWIAQIQVLDITAETQLLREIKDVRDELRIMSMVFQDQKVVLDAMDAINIAALNQAQDGRTDDNDLSEQPADTQGQGGGNTCRAIPNTTNSDPDQEARPGTESGSNTRQQDRHTSSGLPDIITTAAELGDETDDDAPNLPENVSSTFNAGRNIYINGAENFFGSLKHPITFNARNNVHVNSLPPATPTSSTTAAATLTESSTISPRATVQLSIDAIDRMAERATNAYKALGLLVDLKQKQSNVLDARSMRVQTEESLKMTKENERQGKTLMVFTLVTIIFLPMSFMAAFFAIPIIEFKRDIPGNDKLGLGYVSEILFPISAAITAFLIYAAFKVEVMERGWDSLVKHIPHFKFSVHVSIPSWLKRKEKSAVDIRGGAGSPV